MKGNRLDRSERVVIPTCLIKLDSGVTFPYVLASCARMMASAISFIGLRVFMLIF